jgi:hypothetical protein
MDLKQLADECGIGWLMDPEDEFFEGEALTKLAEKITTAERDRCLRLAECRIGDSLIAEGMIAAISNGDDED